MMLRIRSMREDKDLKQKNLANYLGCAQQTYSRYETGELEPSLNVLEKLAIFYETSVDYIMGLTDDEVQRWTDETTAITNYVDLTIRRDAEYKNHKPRRRRRRPVSNV